MLAAALSLFFTKPNFIVIFVDDLGIGDLSCYGNREYKTPNLDRMAAQGVRFTDFYAASPACTPSRAALLTGCYPMRVGLPSVINPDSPIGLNPNEETIPELLKDNGYTTGMFGKWHLGVNNLMPRTHGFDEFVGIPYSHDMWPQNGKQWPPLFLYENETRISEQKDMEDQALLTQKLTDRTLSFIRRNREKPFFIYLPLPMPHVPVIASKSFRDKTGKGPYADTVYEIDDAVGRILGELKKLNLDKNTMVTFSSDNGPWIPYGRHAGSPGIYREGKGTTFEAGVREPAIFWWPGHISAGKVNHEMASTMDILPTLAKLSKSKLPLNKIDGHDIWPLISNSRHAKSPWPYFLYYWPDELQAIRWDKWKLHVSHQHRHQSGPVGKDGKANGEVTAKIDLSLYDLQRDPSETTNLADQHADVVQHMLKLMDEGRNELGDSITKTKGTGVRAPGKVIFPKPNS